MPFDPITAIAGIIDKIIPDRAQADAAKAQLAAQSESDEVKLALAQLSINQADAQSKNWFQAVWRPALAWDCVLSFIYHMTLYPVLSAWYPVKDIDAQSFALMMGVLTVLIGARTYDKSQGTDTK